MERGSRKFWGMAFVDFGEGLMTSAYSTCHGCWRLCKTVVVVFACRGEIDDKVSALSSQKNCMEQATMKI